MAFRGRGRGRGRGGPFKRGKFDRHQSSNFEPCEVRDIFHNDENNTTQEIEETHARPRPKELSRGGGKVGKQAYDNHGTNQLVPCDNEEEHGHKSAEHGENSKRTDFKTLNPSRDNFTETNGKKQQRYSKYQQDETNGNNPEKWHANEGYEVDNSNSHHTSMAEEDCPFPKLNEDAKQYFKRVYDQLKEPFETAEDEDIFLTNVMEETVGQEAFLSTTKLGSRCIELILRRLKNSKLIRRFIEAFSGDIWVCCVDLGASHVTQSLLVCCLRFIHNREEYNVSEEDSLFFEEWTIKVAEFCLENLEDLMFHESNSCYVLRTLISVLSGKSVDAAVLRRVVSNNKKNVPDTNSTFEFNYSNTPPTYKKILKTLSKKLIDNENLKDIIQGETSSPIMQVLLLTTSERYPKLCRKIVKKIAKKTFAKSETESISNIFCHERGTYVVEKVIEVANEKRDWLWETFFKEQFRQLCLHARGNFLVQKLIKTSRHKEELEAIFDQIEPILDDIFKMNHSGIISKLSEKCKELDTCQAKFIKAMMTVLQCLEPVERQAEFSTLLLNFQTYDSYHASENLSLNITLAGSLTMQSALFFHKPHKIVMSLLNITVDDLVHIGTHQKGCYIFREFFKSKFVGEKKRDLLVNKLKPQILKLACDKFGSRTVDDIWAESSIKTKSAIAEELCKNESALKNNFFGRHVHRNLALYNFKSRREEWKQYQNMNTKKRKMFDDIIGDLDHSDSKIKKES